MSHYLLRPAVLVLLHLLVPHHQQVPPLPPLPPRLEHLEVSPEQEVPLHVHLLEHLELGVEVGVLEEPVVVVVGDAGVLDVPADEDDLGDLQEAGRQELKRKVGLGVNNEDCND